MFQTMPSLAIDLLIVLYLILAFSWSLPNDFFAKRCIQKVKPVILWAGLWHSWSMFAPSPILVERRLSVLLTLNDGTTESHDLLKMHELGKWTAFSAVRERKFQTVLSQKSSKAQRAAICAHTAKKLASSPDKVVKSQLVIKKRKIKSPTETEDHEIDEKIVWTINYSDNTA